MLRRVPLVVGEFYHCYNRGVEKRIIFSSPDDYLRFTHLLYLANSEKDIIFNEINDSDIFQRERGKPIVAICGYCLMPNHFHLLLHEIEDGGITRFMRKLCTAYSMYFNKRYDRSGVLLQGRFKSRHADNDEYLRHLLSYIHMNPLDLVESGWKKNGLQKPKETEEFLLGYNHSSLPDYLGGVRKQSCILNKGVFPEYYSSIIEMLDDIHDWQAIIPMFDSISDH